MLLFYHYLFIEKKKTLLSAYSQYPCDLLQYNFIVKISPIVYPTEFSLHLFQLLL